MSNIRNVKVHRYVITIEKHGSYEEAETRWVAFSEADGKKEMGWSPEVFKREITKDIIFQQTVTDLDLSAIVHAVNPMKVQTIAADQSPWDIKADG